MNLRTEFGHNKENMLSKAQIPRGTQAQSAMTASQDNQVLVRQTSFGIVKSKEVGSAISEETKNFYLKLQETSKISSFKFGIFTRLRNK